MDKCIKWNEQEVAFLKDNYNNMTDSELGKKLGRTASAIERKRNSLKLFKKVQYSKVHITDEIKDEIIQSKLSVREAYKVFSPKYHITRSQIESLYKKTGISKDKARKWTDDELEYLKVNVKTKSTQEIADELNRTPSAISKKRMQLGLEASNIIYNKSDRDWSTEELLYLKENIENKSYEEIAEHLNRTVKAVMVKATKSNLINRNSNWSKGEEQILIDNIDLPIYALIFILERSEKSILHRASQLGLRIKRRKGETKIERIVDEIIKDFNVDYERYAKPVKDYNYEADFLIGKDIIEINGDYYHGNPKFYNELDNIQTINVKKDSIKKDIFEKNGYRVHYIWEYDICNNLEQVKNKIALIIGDNNNGGSKIGSDSNLL